MHLSNHRPHRRAGRRTRARRPRFVIQHHEARDNYYALRLEIDGVLVSWEIPRGPAVNPQERRMARRREDTPLDADELAAIFDDDVFLWDSGTYANKTGHQMATCLGRGHLSFLLNGDKLCGGYAMTRVRDGDEETWLLVKRRDDLAYAANHLPR